jgi:hypothetical protein
MPDQGAEIEADRTEERADRVDHLGVGLGDQHRARVQVAVDQRLRLGHEALLERRDGAFERVVLADRASEIVELGRRPAILGRFQIGFGERQMLGQPANLGIAAEEGDALLLLRRGHRQVRGPEQGLAQEAADLLGEARIDAGLDDAAAQRDVRMQTLQNEERLLGIEVQDARHKAGGEAGVERERRLLEHGPLERQRPAAAKVEGAVQGLLDADRTRRPFGDENRAELARRDLADLPQLRPAAESGGDVGQGHEIAAEPVLGHLAVGHGAEYQHPSNPCVDDGGRSVDTKPWPETRLWRQFYSSAAHFSTPDRLGA